MKCGFIRRRAQIPGATIGPRAGGEGYQLLRSFFLIHNFAHRGFDNVGSYFFFDVLDQLGGLHVFLLGEQRQLFVAHRFKRPNELDAHILGDQVEYGLHVGDDVLFIETVERLRMLAKMTKGVLDCLPRPFVEVALAAPSRVRRRATTLPGF
jgi:hypothetical protein